MDAVNPDDLSDPMEKRKALEQRNTIFAFERMRKAGTLETFELPVYLSLEEAKEDKSRVGVVRNLVLTDGGVGAMCHGTLIFSGNKERFLKRYPTIVTYRGLPKCMVLIDYNEL